MEHPVYAVIITCIWFKYVLESIIIIFQHSDFLSYVFILNLNIISVEYGKRYEFALYNPLRHISELQCPPWVSWSVGVLHSLCTLNSLSPWDVQVSLHRFVLKIQCWVHNSGCVEWQVQLGRNYNEDCATSSVSQQCPELKIIVNFILLKF